MFSEKTTLLEASRYRTVWNISYMYHPANETCLTFCCVKRMRFTPRKREAYPSTMEMNGIPITHTHKKYYIPPWLPLVGLWSNLQKLWSGSEEWWMDHKIRNQKNFRGPFVKVNETEQKWVSSKADSSPVCWVELRFYWMGAPLNTVLMDPQDSCYMRSHFI